MCTLPLSVWWSSSKEKTKLLQRPNPFLSQGVSLHTTSQAKRFQSGILPKCPGKKEIVIPAN